MNDNYAIYVKLKDWRLIRLAVRDMMASESCPCCGEDWLDCNQIIDRDAHAEGCKWPELLSALNLEKEEDHAR